MTPEEFERAIEFILKNQAKFDLRMDRLAESQDRTASQLAELGSKTDRLSSTVDSLVSTTTDLVGVSRHLLTTQGELVESNRLLTELVTHQSRRLDRLEDRTN